VRLRTSDAAHCWMTCSHATVNPVAPIGHIIE
jgi:hypothetical protein